MYTEGDPHIEVTRVSGRKLLLALAHVESARPTWNFVNTRIRMRSGQEWTVTDSMETIAEALVLSFRSARSLDTSKRW